MVKKYPLLPVWLGKTNTLEVFSATVGAVDVPPTVILVFAAVTEVTGAVPFDAAVNLPCESTVIDE